MKKFITLTLLALLASPLLAQLSKRPTTIGGGLEVSIPRGEFNDTWGEQLFGLSANMAIPMRRLPFDIGGDFSWTRMGRQTRSVPVNETFVAATQGNLEVTSNVYGYHGLIRLKPFNGKISPYIEGMAGLRQFATSTRINVEGLDADLYRERNANSFVFSTGWAAGVQFMPTKVIYIEGRLERLTGSQVKYVDPNSITISPSGEVNFSTLKSGTSVLNVCLGVGFRF